jgi:hypothetical protein
MIPPLEADLYLVLRQPLPINQAKGLVAPLALTITPFGDEADPSRWRALRLAGDIEGERLLAWVQAEAGGFRWLEFGLRGYGVLEKRREARPWRRNAHLSLAQLAQLARLEPEVRYQVP